MTSQKSKITKVVAGLLGFVMALTLVAGAVPAQADTTSDVAALTASIAQLQAQLLALQGGTSGGTCAYTFTLALKVGSRGQEVMNLQKVLNMSADTRIAATGAGSPGNETSYFGPATRAAVIKFQLKNGLPGVGNVGPLTRTKLAAVCVVTPATPSTPGTPGTVTPVTGTGLRVTLASDSPNNVALVQGQSAGELAKFTFVNPTASPVSVTSLSFRRTGVSNDATMTNVYLYSGALRLTDSAGVSNSAFNFNSPTGLFTVPAGGSYTVSVRSDIASSNASGQLLGVQLTSVTATAALDTSVSLPISSYLQTISTATLASIDFAATTLPSVSTAEPQADYNVWQNTVTVGTRAVLLKSFALRNIGSILNTDIRNFRLYVDGTQVGSAVASLDANSMVTFDLSATPARLETGGRVVKVLADIVGGASRTFQFSLRYASDATFVDTDLGQPVLGTANGSAFSARSATSATINSISSSAPSVTRASDSPSANVSVGASNVKWATFKMVANGEDVKIDNLNVNVDTSGNTGLDNGKVFLNGVQVGSTKDLTEATDVNYTFGSSFILRVGQVATVDIYADAKSTAGVNLANNATVAVSLTAGSSNGQGQISLASTNVPASTVSGLTITVSSSTLTATKFSGYGNQTIIAGSSNVKIGSFTLSTGSTEGVNVNTIEIGFASAVSSTISDLVLKDAASGVQIGSTKTTIGTTNSFSSNVNIPASGTKTIDIYANVKSGANIGAIPATTVTTSTTGTGLVTGNSASVSTAATLQTITIGTGVLTVAVNTGSTPDTVIAIAGTSGQKVGSFRFTSQYSPFTVSELKVKVPANAATSVSSVILKYKDVNGTTQTANQALTLSSGASQTHSTATFTGLSFYIPQNTSRDLDVYVDIPTIEAGATSGAAISAVLDADEGFRAIDSAGNADTSLDSSDQNSAATSGKGTLIVRKSVPTLTKVALDTATLTAASNKALARVNIAANAAGDVSWAKLVFTVNKSSALSLGATTTLALYQGSTQITGTFATTTGSLVGGNDSLQNQTTGILAFIPTSEQQIPAGSSVTYELRGTTGNLATSAYNYVNVSIANPSSSNTTDTASNIGTDNDNTPSFTWSDRSVISSVHDTTTSDWTNDYLLKVLPLDLGTQDISL